MPSQETIVVVESDRERANYIIDALKDSGWQKITVISETSSLERQIKSVDPDVVLIDLGNPDRDLLEAISSASDAESRAVAMFVDTSDDDLTHVALNAGLSAYVVGEFETTRIKSILQTAMARFKVTSQIRAERDAAKQALVDRKAIDRAKGLIMRSQNVGEDEAYQILRKTAMNQKRKMIDVANALILASEVLL